MTLPSIHSKSNTSSGLAWFSVSSSTTSSGFLKSCGHSPSSSRPSLFSHNSSCCKEQERRKPSQLIISPLSEGTGPSTFRTGYTGTCGYYYLGVVPILMNFPSLVIGGTRTTLSTSSLLLLASSKQGCTPISSTSTLPSELFQSVCELKPLRRCAGCCKGRSLNYPREPISIIDGTK